MYFGPRPLQDYEIIFKSISGVMSSVFLIFVKTRAAEFCSSCRQPIIFLERPEKRTLQQYSQLEIKAYFKLN